MEQLRFRCCESGGASPPPWSTPLWPSCRLPPLSSPFSLSRRSQTASPSAAAAHQSVQLGQDRLLGVLTVCPQGCMGAGSGGPTCRCALPLPRRQGCTCSTFSALLALATSRLLFCFFSSRVNLTPSWLAVGPCARQDRAAPHSGNSHALSAPTTWTIGILKIPFDCWVGRFTRTTPDVADCVQ